MSRGAGRGNVLIDEDNKAVVLYEASPGLFVCRASIGSALSDAVWQIMRVDTTSGIVVTWADGNSNYDNVATDSATVQGLSYS